MTETVHAKAKAILDQDSSAEFVVLDNGIFEMHVVKKSLPDQGVVDFKIFPRLLNEDVDIRADWQMVTEVAEEASESNLNRWFTHQLLKDVFAVAEENL